MNLLSPKVLTYHDKPPKTGTGYLSHFCLSPHDNVVCHVRVPLSQYSDAVTQKAVAADALKVNGDIKPTSLYTSETSV